MQQPSNLDPATYPAAINRYFDYAVIHVMQTNKVHISGYFATWHRYFTHLFEQDLRNLCGYTGPFPYWNPADTYSDIHNNVVFDGSEYSMSGDGAPNNTGPIALGPNLVIPHGSGGGCVTSGPFADLTTTLGFIDPLFLLTGKPLPPNTFNLNESCLVRDLNQYVASTWTTPANVSAAVHAPSAAALEYAYNGIIGQAALGIHSAGHFTIGGPMSSIHVSPQDRKLCTVKARKYLLTRLTAIWYPLHVFIDLVYTSWQINNPDIANTLYGTETANNAPPSPNVTLSSVEPGFGYLESQTFLVSDLISTTAGPFCYRYDQVLE